MTKRRSGRDRGRDVQAPLPEGHPQRRPVQATTSVVIRPGGMVFKVAVVVIGGLILAVSTKGATSVVGTRDLAKANQVEVRSLDAEQKENFQQLRNWLEKQEGIEREHFEKVLEKIDATRSELYREIQILKER